VAAPKWNDRRFAQVCEFDPGLYWNCGAGRIPSHHQTVLGYCRELGGPLEVEVNMSRGARLLNPAANGGKPIEMRQAVNDVRGEISELLGKALDRGALDHELTARDKERMAAFLKQYGDLSPDLLFKGSPRSGYKTLPGAGETVGMVRDPVPLGVLLDIDMWGAVLADEAFAFQATMFQPVGGMDRIPEAFAQRLGGMVRLMSEVTAIRRRDSGVAVDYLDKRTGKRSSIDASYCLVTIPLKVLAAIDGDFSVQHRAASGHRLRRCGQDRVAVAPVLGDRRADLWRDFVGERADRHGLVPKRSFLLGERNPARRLCDAGRRRPARGKADGGAGGVEPGGDRRVASRAQPRARETDGSNLVEGAVQPGHLGALHVPR
jgi:monoamine oxidase